MNYRVYVKKAKDNIISSLIRGTINGNTGEATEDPNKNWYITKNFISVNINHIYELVKISKIGFTYYICEYDSELKYLNGTSYQKYDRNDPDKSHEKTYIPTSSDVAYVKLQIEKTNDISKDFMFLRSSEPVLIHDSKSPEKEYHLQNANLHLEDSAAGTFEFLIWPGHKYYNTKINLWTDTFYIVRSYSNGSERIIWDGRAITEDIVDGNKSYHCEGAISYLNDLRVLKLTGASSVPNLTVTQFIDTYILERQNDNSISNNRMDRSFYYKKENGAIVDGSSILCEQGIKYQWNMNYESGYKWIDDIKKSFGGHYRIRYRSYDSVKDEIICRCFTYLQSFDRFIRMTNFSKLTKGTKVETGSLFYYTDGPKSYRIYKVLRDFVRGDLNSRADIEVTLLLSSIYITFYDQNDIGYATDEDSTNNTKNVWIINNSYVIVKPDSNRFTSFYASFGSEIFEAEKTSQISNFASTIIPRGATVNSSDGTESHIDLLTTGAFVTGNYKGKIGNTTIQGYRNYNPAKDKDGNLVTSIYLTDYSLTKQYGYVEAIVDFEGADTPQKLYNQAYNWFKDLKTKILKESIEITLFDLNKKIISKSSDPFSDPEYVDIWTQIYAVIPSFGINQNDPERYFVSAMDIPLDDYINTKITLINNANLISDNVINAGDIKGSSKGIIDTAS